MTEILPQAALAEIIDAIAVARRDVADGAHIELAGLDGAVTRVCEAARGVALSERGIFASKLDELAGALDRLAGDIARQRDAASQRRAQDAYAGEDGA